MDQDVQTDVLYDFLYRDSGRIGSYYAQIFGGKLSSFEKTESEREVGDRTGKASLSIVSVEGKTSRETQSGDKQTFDPHDVVASDVLGILTRTNRLSEDIKGATHGALILTQGTLVFVDKSIMELATKTFGILVQAEQRKPKHKRDPDILGLEVLLTFLDTLVIPSAFMLLKKDGTQIVGTLKEAGMEEPISTYYFKHGTDGLSDVYLLGIKEIRSPAFSLPDQQFFAAGQKAAQALSDMLFPKDAIRVTPIAMFRKL